MRVRDDYTIAQWLEHRWLQARVPGSCPGGDSQFFLQTFPVCLFPSNQSILYESVKHFMEKFRSLSLHKRPLSDVCCSVNLCYSFCCLESLDTIGLILLTAFRPDGLTPKDCLAAEWNVDTNSPHVASAFE